MSEATPTIDPICGLAITHADRVETLRLLAQFLAKHPPGFDDDDDLRFVLAEVPST